MRPRNTFSRATQRGARRAMLPLMLAVSLAGLAQDPQDEPPPPNDHPYVLHVYANLVQVPTLVLDRNLNPVKTIPRDKFLISLDSGTPFHPTLMRMEGDDPIYLTLLIDATGRQQDILITFAKSLGALVPKYLHPSDHLSIFAMDCKLIRSFDGTPTSTDVVRDGVNHALHAEGLHGAKTHGACEADLPLWDAMLRVTTLMADVPGRRVLLVVSDGYNGLSKTAPHDLADYAASLGVAIFGLSGPTISSAMQSLGNSDRGGPSPGGPGFRSAENLFDEVCQRNGGYAQRIRDGMLPSRLEEFITLLRNRYILEYPRPDKSAAGMHDLRVSVSGNDYFVRPTGYSTPLPDPNRDSDPTTVPVAPSPATLGTRRPLAAKK